MEFVENVLNFNTNGMTKLRILNKEKLASHGNIEGRAIALDLLEEGLRAADPYDNTKKIIRRENQILSIGDDDFVPYGSPRKGVDKYCLGEDINRVFVFGAGKGIQRVAAAIEDVLGDYLDGGRILIKHKDEHSLKKIAVSYAGHPVPDLYCLESCKKLVNDISNLSLTNKDLVFVIIGNGASSMLTFPWDELDFDEVAKVTEILQIQEGLSTPDVNIVRNQLDRLKGGRLTRLFGKAKLVHLFPIDLNEPNAYGHGGYEGHVHWNFWLHSLPDISTPEKAIDILKKSGTFDRVGKSITKYLNNVPNGRDVLSVEEFESTDSRIFGVMPSSCSFIDAVMNKAKKIGYEPHFLMRRTFVDASSAGKLISRIAQNVEDLSMPFSPPCVLLLTGETLVAVNKHIGVGGRNQEFALASAMIIKGSKRIVCAAVDTDGTDGPGGAFNKEAIKEGCDCLAGGLVDGSSFFLAQEKGIDVEQLLKNHDASNALWSLEDGVWAMHNISVQDLVLFVVMDHDGVLVIDNKNCQSVLDTTLAD